MLGYVIHDKFNPRTLENDIAIVKIAEHAQSTSFVCLANLVEDSTEGILLGKYQA